MKFIDLINEGTNVDKERKRVKTVHKAIRKGIVTVEGYRFRYELPEEYKIFITEDEKVSIQFTFRIDDVTIENGGLNLPLKVWKIVDGKDESINEPLTGYDIHHIIYGDPHFTSNELIINYVNVKNKVKNKYRDFSINNIMLDPSDVINESNDDYIKKQIKKGKTVYNALKSGTIGGDDPEQPHFKYKLPDKFSVYTNNVGVLIEIERIKIKHLNRGCLLHSSDYMSSLIRKKFGHFGIVLTSLYGDRYFQYDIDSWESPNE